MKKLRKFVSLLLCAVLLCTVLASCSAANGNQQSQGKLKIVCTVFPQYDWVMQILAEKSEDADVTLLLDNGVDLHNYQPTADDIITISNCDMFIYVGGESDEWVEDVLSTAKNDKMIAVNMMNALGDSVKEEETVEGMEVEEHGKEAEKTEYDEHIWLSLRNARVLCRYIADKLAVADEANGDYYIANAENYIFELNKLDTDFQSAVSSAKHKALVFGDRFPFRYLADDYNIEYYAAFSGCSAETEASFETISFLAKKVDELGLSAVLTIDGSDSRIAETVIKNTKGQSQKILALDSMQSATSNDIKAGKTYLSVMEKNLQVLKEALA
ncbi:MAG: metal ABC transporter substrate-binding protein [Eubacterium sp.]